MNKKILQKCIEELKSQKPSIPYILGMLETLMEMSEPSPVVAGYVQSRSLDEGVKTMNAVAESISTPTGGMSPEERAIVESLKAKKK